MGFYKGNAQDYGPRQVASEVHIGHPCPNQLLVTARLHVAYELPFVLRGPGEARLRMEDLCRRCRGAGAAGNI
jgi:hypothetical protein